MSLNGVSSTHAANYYDYAATTSKKSEETTETKNTTSDTGVVYESTAKTNYAVVAKMKADSQSRLAQMQSLVSQMFSKQGIKIGTADDMWKALAGGNFSADPETIAQAKADIAEDGYWGVTQTSDRIFDFAMALSGGDKETMEKMQEAVKKGFQEATGSWGRELPSICSDTYDAVMNKFEEFYKNN